MTTDQTPLTSQDLDEIEARAASLYEADADQLAGTDVRALIAEVRRLQAELDRRTEDLAPCQPGLDDNELLRLQARVAELERPAVEAKRNKIRDSFAELAAAAREDRDFEGAFNVECDLRKREEQWAAEDAVSAAGESGSTR